MAKVTMYQAHRFHKLDLLFVICPSDSEKSPLYIKKLSKENAWEVTALRSGDFCSEKFEKMIAKWIQIKGHKVIGLWVTMQGYLNFC